MLKLLQVHESSLLLPSFWLEFEGNQTPQERLEKLKERFPENDWLFTYFRIIEVKLKDLLNLVQEEKLKLMGSTGKYRKETTKWVGLSGSSWRLDSICIHIYGIRKWLYCYYDTL